MSLSTAFRKRWRIAAFLLPLVLVFSMLPFISHPTHAASSHNNSQPFSVSYQGRQIKLAQNSTTPPTDAQCRKNFGFDCFSPQELYNAYNIASVLKAGHNGAGQTIAIIDGFGSPTIQSDLKIFDAGYGIPDPPSFRIYAPLGTIKFNHHDPFVIAFGFESSLDVEWAHAMAPEANISLITSPVNETNGDQGLPEFLYLEQYVMRHHLGTIISQSWGTAEETLFTPGGRLLMNNYNSFYQQAGKAGITVLADAGDTGVANVNVNGKIIPYPTVTFPATSPYVTTVGGTTLNADTHGNYQSETVWNSSSGTTGGGISKYFTEPSYQQKYLPSSDQTLLNGYRGLPDVAYNADYNTGYLVYLGFMGKKSGYFLAGGDDGAAPQWAGLIADANQWAGHPLGLINPILYKMGASKDYSKYFHDITVGNNNTGNIIGFNATPGWDPTTGWGTPKADTLLAELVKGGQ